MTQNTIPETKDLLSCGEFAKLCNTSKQTIIYYDKLGIIKPYYVDRYTGYRYYSTQSLELFVAIKGLKYSGLSLSEIASFLKNQSKIGFKQLIAQQQELIDNHIKYLLDIKQLFSQKIKDLEYSQQKLLDVYIEDIDERDIILTKYTGNGIASLSNHISKLNKSTKIISYSTICSLENIKNKSYDSIGYYSDLPNSSPEKSNEKIHAGSYLCILYKGSTENIGLAYELLIKYAEQNSISLCDLAYEQLLLDSFSVANENEYIYKIFIRISS